MTEDQALARFGTPPTREDLNEIRYVLEQESTKERGSQGAGDTQTMRLCCVYLFVGGSVDDALLIWRAKTASMDADASIDVHLLCGQGLEETRRFLGSRTEHEAADAVSRLAACEAAGDFEGFDVDTFASECIGYYGDS